MSTVNGLQSRALACTEPDAFKISGEIQHPGKRIETLHRYTRQARGDHIEDALDALLMPPFSQRLVA